MNQIIRKRPRAKRLWRYMNYERFVDLLKTGSLYFTKPSQFEDKNEGMLSLSWQAINAYFDNGEKAHNDLFSQFQEITPPYISYEDKLNYYLKSRDEYGVSCWHSNRTQPLAMWDLYVGKGKDGVAITTTFDRLYAALQNYHNRISVGRVEYCDLMYHDELSYRLKDKPKGKVLLHEQMSMSPLDTLFQKDLSYSLENEVRAVIKLECDKDGNPIQKLQIPLDLLIEQVIISPYSKGYFVNEIKRVLEKSNLSPNLTYRSDILNERKNYAFEKLEGGVIRRIVPEEY